MKKLVLLLVMLALVMPAFADDAKVLPAGVLRTYIAPSYSFASEAFDADGEKVDLAGDQSFFNIGAAFEYGVNDWISAAIQWAPGYNVSSSFEDKDYQTANGIFEAFVGAKMQFVGPNAPSKSDKIRVAFAPGVMVPMAYGYDAEEEGGNAADHVVYAQTSGALGSNTTEYNALPADNVFGFGGRFYADYVMNKSFYLNLYSEFKYFLPKNGEDDLEEQTAFQATSTLNSLNPLVPINPIADEINYGYELTLEIEPHYATMVADGIELSTGIPVTYVMTPAVEADDVERENTATKILKVSPSVSAFVQKFLLPMEVKLGYTYPIWGENSTALNTIVGQLKFYAKF